MANRFTSYSPREFQQTYQPLPMDQMIRLGQIGQQRNDAIDVALGAAQADMGINSGYATQDYAKNIEQEYMNKYNTIADAWGTDRNISATIQALSKLKAEKSTDPRIKLAQSDYETKAKIDAQIGQKGYGISSKHGAYDDKTGQWNIGDLKAMADSGQLITAANYHFMENQGDLKTYSPYIDKISADISQTYEIDPTDGIRKHKETNEVLDYSTILGKSSPLLSGFRNEDGSINMEALTALDPVMAENAMWKMDALAKENRTFLHDDLVDDYMGVAALSFKEIKKEDGSLRTKSQRELKAEKEAEQASGLFSGPHSPTPFTITTATNDPSAIITSNEQAARALGINPITGKDDVLGTTSSDLIYAPSITYTPEELKAYQDEHYAKVNDYTNKVYKNEYAKLKAKNPKVKVGDTWQYSGMTPEEMTQEASASTAALMVKHNKYASALSDTQIEAAARKIASPTSEEGKKEVIKVAEEEKDKIFLDLTEKAFNTVVGKSEAERNQFFKEHPALAKAVSHPYYDESKTRTEDEVTKGSTRVNYDYIKNNKNAILAELGDVTQREIGRPLGKMDKPKQKITFQEAYGYKIKDIEAIAAVTIYKKYNKLLDDNIKKQFGQEERTSTGYHVLSVANSDFTEKEIPESHKLLANLARGLAIKDGVGIEFNGIPVNSIKSENGETGRYFGDLYINADGETADFTKGDGIKFEPYKFYMNTEKDKWMMQGYYHTNTKDGELTSAAYDVDITDNITEMMSRSEIRDVLAYDRASDIVNGTPKGTTSQALMGMSDKIKATFGDIRLSQTPSGYYRVNAKFNDPLTGEMTTVDDYIYKMNITNGTNINPRKMSKEEARGALATVYTMQQEYDMGIGDNVETYAELQEADTATGGAWNYTSNTIGKFESASLGGYNAMNQGSEDAEGTKPINPGDSNKILGKPLTGMTVQEIMDAQALPKENANRIHAAGKLQFTKDTLAEFVEKAGIDPSDKFNETTQERLGLALFKEVAGSSDNLEVIMKRLEGRWVGLQNADWATKMQMKKEIQKLKTYYGI